MLLLLCFIRETDIPKLITSSCLWCVLYLPQIPEGTNADTKLIDIPKLMTSSCFWCALYRPQIAEGTNADTTGKTVQ